MKSGALGVAIIFIAFLSTVVIYSTEVTNVPIETINYESQTNDIIKMPQSYESPEYRIFTIPKNQPDDPRHVTLYDKVNLFKPDSISLTYIHITPLKTILNSLKYSKNCDSITIDFDIKTEKWKKYDIIYPTTPILCEKIPDHPHHLKPIGYNNSKFSNIIFDYKIGSNNIYLKSPTTKDIPIEGLIVGHHYSNLTHAGFTNEELKLNESDYTIKWRENKIKNIISNPIINIKDKHPAGGHSKVTLNNFTQYGNEITINGQTFHVINGKIHIDKKPYSIQNIDIYYYDNNTCSLKLNNNTLMKDLGKTHNYIISGRGVWGFTPHFYEGQITQDITSKLNINPIDIFQMDGGAILLFIAIVIILSGVCSYSSGLYFTDWAIILTTIAILLIMW